MKNMKVAAIQMNSCDSVSDNLILAAKLVTQAAQRGAIFVLLPEYFYFMGTTDESRVMLGETPGNGPIQSFLAELARANNIWLSAGTVPLRSQDPTKVYNTNLLFNDSGICVGRYDKIHLFGFNNGSERYAEADTLVAGNTVQTFNTVIGNVRASVCYDLRFPEMYRQSSGYDVITAPAAFTYTTGEAHWETLLRSRAIENQCYVIAAAQTGVHPNGKRTFGHSMIIDPWGVILDQKEEGNGFVIAEIDSFYTAKIRPNLPASNNRVFI